MNVLWITALRKAWKSCDIAFGQSSPYRLFKNKIRTTIMVLRYKTESMEWFERIERHDFNPFIVKIPSLALKPMRVYMSKQWNLTKRKKVLLDTYLLISRYPALVCAIIQDHGFELARFDSCGAGVMRIIACYKHALKKDGELSIILYGDNFTNAIYKMTIAFEQELNGEWLCYIGCIQGAIGKEEIKAATKAMYGLRPSSFMVFVAQEIAASLEEKVSRMMGLGNDIHSHKAKHLIHIRKIHKLDFNYNSLWKEAGGKLTSDGWFDLPLKLEKREVQEVKSSKRAQYRRRYEMLNDIANQIMQYVSS